MKFNKIRVLGKGSYGIVYLIKDSYDNKKYALKKINYDNELLKSCLNELKILKMVKSNYIINVIDFFKKPSNFNIIMEYAPNGDLLKYIELKKKYNIKIKKNKIKHIIISIIMNI